MTDVLDAAQALLPGARLDEVAVLSEQERATVRRVRVVDADGEHTVVVKHFHGSGEEWVRECAALACLPVDAPAPRLIAECAQPQIAVLTDLRPDDSGRRPDTSQFDRGIADHLLGGDAASAGAALTTWARSLAALHTATRDLHDAFAAELDARAGDLPVSVAPMRNELTSAGELLGRQCASLGVPVPPGTRDALAEVAHRVAAGPCALTPHDTCPDNCVRVGDGLALIDFEGAQWRNIAWDVAYLVVPWPTCWCCWALPQWAADHAVDAYREAAAAAFPEVRRPGFDTELEIAVVGWTLESASVLLDRTVAGAEATSTPRRPTPPRRAVLLHRLDTAARTTALPPLAELAGRLAEDLRGRWGSGHELESAPAFRGATRDDPRR